MRISREYEQMKGERNDDGKNGNNGKKIKENKKKV
jgi:hypothetical protein